MKKWVIVLMACISVQVHAKDFMQHEDVVKEFQEPGHIPQGLPASPYHKLNEIIPPAAQIEIRQEKRKRAQDTQGPNWDEYFRNAKPVDLRLYDTPIRSQWDGTCTAHGTIACLENLLNRIQPVILSTRFHWNNYRKYSGQAAMVSMLKHKQIEDKYWPQDSRKPLVSQPERFGKAKLVESEYLGSSAYEALKAIGEGYPVNVAMSVPQDMASCRSTIRYTSDLTSGGHDVAAVGRKFSPEIAGGAYLILKNSWGEDCGDQGYQYLPAAYCEKPGVYCMFWALKTAEIELEEMGEVK